MTNRFSTFTVQEMIELLQTYPKDHRVHLCIKDDSNGEAESSLVTSYQKDNNVFLLGYLEKYVEG